MLHFDLWWPARGPCGFCGHPDARHRIFDMIHGRHLGGDSIATLAKDYDVPVIAIEFVLENHLYNYDANFEG